MTYSTQQKCIEPVLFRWFLLQLLLQIGVKIVEHIELLLAKWAFGEVLRDLSAFQFVKLTREAREQFQLTLGGMDLFHRLKALIVMASLCVRCDPEPAKENRQSKSPKISNHLVVLSLSADWAFAPLVLTTTSSDQDGS